MSDERRERCPGSGQFILDYQLIGITLAYCRCCQSNVPYHHLRHRADYVLDDHTRPAQAAQTEEPTIKLSLTDWRKLIGRDTAATPRERQQEESDGN